MDANMLSAAGKALLLRPLPPSDGRHRCHHRAGARVLPGIGGLAGVALLLPFFLWGGRWAHGAASDRARAPPARSRTGSLDDLLRLIDWAAIDRHLAPIYASAKGEQAWPPLSIFQALLLAVATTSPT